MPLTEFAGGEDFLLGASRAGKQGKRQTYAALAELRKQEREATQRMLDEQNKARRENPLLGMGQRFKPAGIERTGPKDITIEDFEAGNISAEDYNDMMSRVRGQDPRVTRGLRMADMLGLTSVSRTLFGKDSPFAGAGGMLVGEALRRLMPESNYKYVLDEYGQSVGTSAYTSKPSKTDPLIAAATITPGRGFGPALRSMMGAAKAFDRVVPRPVTAGFAATGVAGATMAQPDEAEAAKISVWKSALKDPKNFATMANRSWNERIRGDLRKLIEQGVYPEGTRRDVIYSEGVAQPAYRPRFMGWKKGETPPEGSYSVIPANAPDIAKEFFNKNNRFIKNNPEEELVWGHDTARSGGTGGTTRGNLFLIPERTNQLMGTDSFKTFVAKKAKETGRTKRQIAAEYGILHTNWK